MKQLVGALCTITFTIQLAFSFGLFSARPTFRKCSDLPKVSVIPQLVFFGGPVRYHFSLKAFYNCSREYFTKGANDLLDNSIAGFILKGNDVVQVNMVNASWTKMVVTNCNNGEIADWYILSIKPTFKGIISCIYACARDGVRLKELKCGATSDDEDVINQELEFVKMVENIPAENKDDKVTDVHSSCPKSHTCP